MNARDFRDIQSFLPSFLAFVRWRSRHCHSPFTVHQSLFIIHCTVQYGTIQNSKTILLN